MGGKRTCRSFVSVSSASYKSCPNLEMGFVSLKLQSGHCRATPTIPDTLPINFHRLVFCCASSKIFHGRPFSGFPPRSEAKIQISFMAAAPRQLFVLRANDATCPKRCLACISNLGRIVIAARALLRSGDAALRVFFATMVARCIAQRV